MPSVSRVGKLRNKITIQNTNLTQIIMVVLLQQIVLM